MATIVYPLCETVRNIVAALLRRSEKLLNEPRVAIVRAHPGNCAVLCKMDDLAEICVRIRYSYLVNRLLVERQRHSGAVVAMVGKTVNGYHRINSVYDDNIVLRLGASSISVFNKCHVECSAIRATLLVILLLLG